MDRHTFILYTDTHIHTHMWCVQSDSSMEAQIQPAGWTAPQPDVMSPLLFMHLFLSSAELSEPKVSLSPPPHPSHPVLQHYSYPLPTKAGKYSMVSTRDKKRNRDRHRGERQGEVEKGAEMFLSLFLFLLFFFDRSLQSLPAWLVKVSAAWQAGLFWQASNS